MATLENYKSKFTGPQIDEYLEKARQIDASLLNKTAEELAGGGAKQVNTLSELPSVGAVNGVYFVKSENATYRWDNDNLKYECVGRDYDNITIINGGNAN